jgi:hypothetical protein
MISLQLTAPVTGSKNFTFPQLPPPVRLSPPLSDPPSADARAASGFGYNLPVRSFHFPAPAGMMEFCSLPAAEPRQPAPQKILPLFVKFA